MNVIEAMRCVQKGKKIRRFVWPEDAYLIGMYEDLYFIDRDNPESKLDIDVIWSSSNIHDILAKDWEIV